MNIDFTQINYLAVLLAIVVNQAVGALWYSPVLFGVKWMGLVGLKKENINRKDSMKGFVFALIFAVINYIIIAAVITAVGNTLAGGLITGFVLSLITAFQLGTNYAYEGRSVKLFLINAFYPIVCYTIGGAIIGVLQS